MNKLTFKQQYWLGLGIMTLCFILASILGLGFISNIGWVVFGLMFVIHPVCPEIWKWRYGKDDKRMKRDFRIAGGVVIIIGLFIKFGV